MLWILGAEHDRAASALRLGGAFQVPAALERRVGYLLRVAPGLAGDRLASHFQKELEAGKTGIERRDGGRSLREPADTRVVADSPRHEVEGLGVRDPAGQPRLEPREQ